MSKVMTPAEFATEVNSTGREVRKFLRSITPREEQPGKGSRWSLPATKADITKLRKQFQKWNQEQAEARAERARKAAEDAAEVVEDDTDEELTETE